MSIYGQTGNSELVWVQSHDEDYSWLSVLLRTTKMQMKKKSPKENTRFLSHLDFIDLIIE